jgi:hypothetical protein
MPTNKRVRVSTAIKHVYALLDPATPEKAALALNLAAESVTVDLGYETDEAWRLVHFLAGQPQEANHLDLEEEWCAEDRMPKELCKAAHESGGIPCAKCGTPLMTDDTGIISCPRCNPTPISDSLRARLAVTQKPTTPNISLEEQRRILHETGLFDEMGNFIGK